jgi:hypothetical protein
VTVLPSHAGDGATEMTWPQRDSNDHASMTPGLIYI